MIRSAVLLCFLSFTMPVLAGIDVRVRGLGPDEENNAYAQLAILDYARRVDADQGAYDADEVQRLFRQGEQDIRSALQPFGWYEPAIESELHGAAPDWTAFYTVRAGRPTVIGKIDVVVEGEGKDHGPLLDLIRDPQPRVGERIRHEDYEELKARLQQAAVAGGYLDADFTRRELRIDPKKRSAEILLTLQTGPRWYFGDIMLDQSGLDDGFLRRYLRMSPGEPFDPGELLATQFAYSDLDYFQTVEIETRKDEAGDDRQIPVIIHASAKKPRVYKFGAGYGTDTGARALAGVEFRRLNQRGHKLRVDLRPSEHISTAIAEYKIPYGTLPGDAISFPVQGLKQDFEGVVEHLYSIGLAYDRQFGKWQRRYYLTFTHDVYTLRDQPEATSILLTPGLSLSRTQLNDPIFPTRGWHLFADVHGASRAVVSDTDFTEVLLRGRAILPVLPKVRLLLRAEYGFAVVGDFQELPPSQRFFAGGDESVRGYEYNSLGPKDDKGNVVGGRYLNTYSAELDWNFHGSHGLAVFADAGGADNDPNVLLHYGAGLGYRYRAPFGAVAVDLAHPFDEEASPVRLHLGVRVGL